MDSAVQHLFAEGWFELRDMLRVLLLSGLFTMVAMLAYRRNAATRRLLLLSTVLVLLLLPWLVKALLPAGVVTVVVEELPALSLNVVLPNFVIWIWLLVAAGLIALQLVRLREDLDHIQNLPALEDPRLPMLANELGAADMAPPPVLKVGSAACSSSLAGNVIVLPRAWSAWDELTLRSVLAHELTHLQRRDDCWLLATRLLVLLYWWMPWLIYLYRLYVRAMEESCDDEASAWFKPSTEYAQGLVNAALPATAGYRNVAHMHEHHLVGRIGRFTRNRPVEANIGGVYWLVLSILSGVWIVTSLQPILPRAGIVTVHPTQLLAAPRDIVITPVSIFPTVDVRTHRLPTSATHGEPGVPPAVNAADVIYPGKAIRRRIEGEVTARFVINRDGSVSRQRIVSSTPEGVFDQAVLIAIRNSRYQAQLSDNSVRAYRTSTHAERPQVNVESTFEFRLEHR